MKACDATCVAPNNCVGAPSFENGFVQACAAPCDYVKNTVTGCPNPDEVCVKDNIAGKVTGCLKAKMDQNAGQSNAQLLLSHYPGAWSRTPFSSGHSPITLATADKHPEIGGAHVVIPNFADGPYTNSPIAASVGADGGAQCAAGWTFTPDGLCHAPLLKGTGTSAPTFNPLTPFLDIQPGVGFAIPIDGERDQFVTGGQFDYRGVLENYIVHYDPWVDQLKSSCVADSNACGAGYSCDPVTKNCVASDNSVRINGIEAGDFLGQVFLCQDPSSGDVLHVSMYDSAIPILNWLAAHPGSTNPNAPTGASSQAACQIVTRRSPANNYIDLIASKANGVVLNISGGQGLGRITDVVLFDPSLVQPL
jgi:hypothetical protein